MSIFVKFKFFIEKIYVMCKHFNFSRVLLLSKHRQAAEAFLENLSRISLIQVLIVAKLSKHYKSLALR
jgi:hypothetical protein